MKTCAALKKDGSGRCKAPPMTGSQWCLSHHPDRVEENRKRSSKGGKRGGVGKATSELYKLQKEMERIAQQVKTKKMDRSIGATTAQILNYARACIRDRVDAREQEELVERMEAIEEALSKQQDRVPKTRYGSSS